MVTLTRAPRPDPTTSDAGRNWVEQHKLLVVLVGLLLLVAAGGAGYLLLAGAGSDDSVEVPASTPRTGAGVAATTGSPSPQASGGSGADGVAGTTTAPAAAGRNPFVGLGGAGSAQTAAPAPTAQPTGALTSAPSSASNPASSPPATATVTATRTTTRAVTATTTAPGSNVFLGLYGWTGDGRPMFRVNEVASTPTPGSTFATSLVYTSQYTSKTLTCANVTYGGVAKSLCEGEVLKLK